MVAAFVLRFEEQCQPAVTRSQLVGTRTGTFVQTERADSDHHEFGTLPSTMPSETSIVADFQAWSRTATVTEVAKESADDDRASQKLTAFPRE